MDSYTAELARKEFEQAEIALKRDDILAALGCLERALAIWDDPHWHSRFGYCVAKERGHLTQAFELCKSAISHDPGNPLHYLYLGKVHLLAAQKYEALHALRQGMTLGSLPEIENTLAAIGARKPPVIRFLARDNRLNKYLGIIMARLGLR